MLLESSDLGVYGLNGRAGSGRLPNAPTVPLQSSVNQSIGHSLNVTSLLGIGEGLISGSLLEAIRVGNVPKAVSSSLSRD